MIARRTIANRFARRAFLADLKPHLEKQTCTNKKIDVMSGKTFAMMALLV